MRGRVRRAVGTEMLAVAALLVAGVVAAGPVRASAQEYVDNIHRLGINVPGGDVELLEWGYEACKLLDLGKDYQAAKVQAIYNSQRSPRYGMTVEQADEIMHYAIANLCNDKT